MTGQTQELHRSVTTIMRALKIAEARVGEAHRELNFVAADIATLRYVATHEDCKLSDLAGHLGVVATTASSIVDRLVERGFLNRERPASNRRAIALQLTNSGREAFGWIEAEEMAKVHVMLEALPKTDRKGFVLAMSTIARHVSSLEDD